MITYFETNKVYFAKGMTTIRYVEAEKCLLALLHNKNVKWDFLPRTSSPLHIWARDYMPIQVNKDKFVRFCYNPDYLQNSPEYKPKTSAILSGLGLQVLDSDIILDGGNVISCGDKVIMTDKIIRENPRYSKNELVDTLTKLLEAEIVLIPEDVYEEYGHADGMVRYMGEDRVLLNNYIDFDKSLRMKLLYALKPHFDIVELHYDSFTDKSWAYINFLHIGRYIFVPMFEDKLSKMALGQIAEAFPQCECHPVGNCDNIIKDGGALNCISWSVLED